MKLIGALGGTLLMMIAGIAFMIVAHEVAPVLAEMFG